MRACKLDTDDNTEAIKLDHFANVIFLHCKVTPLQFLSSSISLFPFLIRGEVEVGIQYLICFKSYI